MKAVAVVEVELGLLRHGPKISASPGVSIWSLALPELAARLESTLKS